MLMETNNIEFQLSKLKDDYRNYDDQENERHSIVKNHYYLMRKNQTLEFVDRMLDKYNFNKPRQIMSIRDAFKVLETYVDSSDPDVSLPNMIHMMQTAEGIRKAGHPDWFQLVGLIHDMGKIMFLWGDESIGQNGTATGSQWALGGDTWIVGCRIPDCTVFPEFNFLNPDHTNPQSVCSTEYGIYQPQCGLKNVKFAYGHDEYMYQMLIANKCTIPEEGLAMIRYHSCYPWHTGNAYRHLMKDEDYIALKWVLEFNKFDLYTKDDNTQWLAEHHQPHNNSNNNTNNNNTTTTTTNNNNNNNNNINDLWEYYQGLIEKYFPSNELNW